RKYRILAVPAIQFSGAGFPRTPVGRWQSARSLALVTVFLLISLVQVQSQQPNVPPEFIRATQAMREGKLEEAAAGFAAAVKRQPAFAEAHFNLGLADEELGKYDEAVVSLREALKLKPRLHGANLFLGIAEFRLNHLDEAAKAVENETDGYPKDA